MKQRVLYSLLIGMFCISLASRLWAHPVSLSVASAVIRKDRIDVHIEVMAEDFMLFYSLLPNNDNYISAQDIQSSTLAHEEFLLRDFGILDLDGNRLEGKVTKVNPAMMEPQGISVDKLMDIKVSYFLEYALKKAPQYLTFYQHFGRNIAVVLGSMELTVKQHGSTHETLLTLNSSGAPRVVEFDWDNPGSHQGPQIKPPVGADPAGRRMGIESYDSVYAFIYIERDEVRLEILIPLLTLETWLTVERQQEHMLEVSEQKAACDMIGRFLSAKNKVTIDGIRIDPSVQRLDFYGVDFKDFAMRPTLKPVSALTARVGAILSYRTKGPPQQIDIVWGLLNSQVYAAQSAVFTFDESLRHKFSLYNPTFKWTNPGLPPFPKITHVKIAERSSFFSRKTKITGEDATTIFATLHKNIYRAFDYRQERDVYNALDKSVGGDLLADLYLQIRKSQIMQEQGGAVSRVKKVNLTETVILKNGAHSDQHFGIQATWTVEGTVEHWGHIHTRVNQYQAAFTVEILQDAWKITDMKVHDQKRLRYNISLRRF